MHVLIGCTCFDAACQRYLGVDTRKELFVNVESRNIVAFIKDAVQTFVIAYSVVLY